MSDQQSQSSEPKSRRKRRTTEALTDLIIVAANQEFGQNGYAGATTAAIARRADVTEAQLFRLYGSKEALFKAAIFQPLNRHFSEFMADDMVVPGEAESLRTSAHAYISALQDFMEQNSRMLMSLIVASTYSTESSQQVSELEGLRAYFDRGAALTKRHRGKPPAVDPQLMVRVSFAAVLACMMFKDWLFPKDFSQEDIRQAIVSFVMDGIDIQGD